MKTPKEKYPRITPMFMHGLCHTIAIEANEKLGLPIVVAVDYDEDYEGDILVHAANLLPNGKIIDIEKIYSDKNEFEEALEEEFELLTEFRTYYEKRPSQLLEKIKKDLSMNDFYGEGDEKEIVTCFEYAMAYIKDVLENIEN